MRQKIRKLMVLMALLLFPVTLNYFSPYVPIDGAMVGIVAGSLLLFAALFLTATVSGRAWCGWLCPMAGLSDFCLSINDNSVNVKRLRIIRYSVFVVWAGVLVAMFVLAGGIKGINPLHLTENGISVDAPLKYIVYYGVLLLFLGTTVSLGKRGACHAFCWMSPFLVAGSTIGMLARLPQLGISADSSRCVECGICDKKCPMGVQIATEVQRGEIKSTDCILCGECVDICKKGVLGYAVRQSKKTRSPHPVILNRK